MSRFINFIGALLICACLLASDTPTTAPAGDDLPKPPDNAALQYWQAFAMASGDVEALRAARPVNREHGLSLTARLLGSNTNAVRYLRRGAAMPTVDWGLAYEDGFLMSVPHLARATHLAQAGLLWARQAAFEKRFNDALMHVADVLVFARHTAADPIHLALLSGAQIQDDAIQQLAPELSAMPKDALLTFAKRLRSLPQTPTLPQVFRMNRTLLARQHPTMASQPADVIAQWRTTFEALDALNAELIRITELPPDQWTPAEEAFLSKLRKLKPGEIGFITPRTLKQNRTIVRSEVRLRLLAAAVAVLLDGPDQAAHFSDPYLNKPIRYELAEGGFELISQLVLDGKPLSLRIGK